MLFNLRAPWSVAETLTTSGHSEAGNSLTGNDLGTKNAQHACVDCACPRSLPTMQCSRPSCTRNRSMPENLQYCRGQDNTLLRVVKALGCRRHCLEKNACIPGKAYDKQHKIVGPSCARWEGCKLCTAWFQRRTQNYVRLDHRGFLRSPAFLSGLLGTSPLMKPVPHIFLVPTRYV